MYYSDYAPKNIIQTKVYKDFFNSEDLQIIHNSIDRSKQMEHGSDFYAPVIQKGLSRVHIELQYPDELLKRIENFASELCGEPVVLTHNSYYHYSKKYNPSMETPILQPHRDFDNYYSKLTLDYQLEKNINWDIIIEGDRYNLEVGDMLAFWGAGLVHWRENIVLEDEDYTTVLTFHFSNARDHETLGKLSRTEEERAKRNQANSEDELLQKYKKVWEEERVEFNNRKNGE
jgi:hypothetical protein